MTEPSGPVVIAIEIGESELADRLAALLADLPGLRLAAPRANPLTRRSWPDGKGRPIPKSP
jgi:hypothetical protein